MKSEEVRSVDWDERYLKHQTPWETNQPSTELQRVLADHQIAPCQALELGSGTGSNSVFLATRGFEVTGVELSANAVTQARDRATHAKVDVRWYVGDILAPPDLGDPFPFVFDRGVYHVVRNVDIEAFRETLKRYSAPGGLYLTLAGNANDPDRNLGGPPRIQVDEMYSDLSPLFELIELREMQFDPVVYQDTTIQPLGWTALWRRKSL